MRQERERVPEPEPATCRECGAELSRCIDCERARELPIGLSSILEWLDDELPSMLAWDLVDLRRVVEREVQRRGGVGCEGLREMGLVTTEQPR